MLLEDFVFVSVFHQKYKLLLVVHVFQLLFNVQKTLSKFAVYGVSEQGILFDAFLLLVLAVTFLCLVHKVAIV